MSLEHEALGALHGGPTTPGATAASEPQGRLPWRRRASTRENAAGWLFTAPVLLVFLVFLVFPIVMSLWVSLLDWNGLSNPLTDFEFIGLENYRRLLTEERIATTVRLGILRGVDRTDLRVTIADRS